MASIDQLKGMVSSKLGFARSNEFLVKLPSLTIKSGLLGLLGGALKLDTLIPSIPGLGGGGPATPNELDLVCKSVNMPGRQLFTADRQIGTVPEKVVWGFGNTDVSMTFYLLNDYGAKAYFEKWMDMAYNRKTHEPQYKSTYRKDIEIHQLRKPLLGLGGGLGPIRVNIGLGGGSVHSVKLIDAFPVSMSQVDLTNEQDGLIEVSVSFAYTDYEVVKPSQNFINFNISPGQIFG